MFSRPIDVVEVRADLRRAPRRTSRRPALTLVIVRDDMLARTPSIAADDAAVRRARGEQVDVQHAAGVRASTSCGSCSQWLVEAGRPAAIEKRNVRKAGKLYAEIDRTGFYRGHAAKDSRSRMNVTFRLPSEELEKKFAKEATAAGSRRPEGPPVGGRHARVDLQRVPGGRRRRARPVHARNSSARTADKALTNEPQAVIEPRTEVLQTASARPATLM